MYLIDHQFDPIMSYAKLIRSNIMAGMSEAIAEIRTGPHRKSVLGDD